MVSVHQKMLLVALSCLVVVVFGPVSAVSEPAPPAIVTQPFSFNILDGIKGATQAKNQTFSNGTMTGMYAYPTGGNEWQVVNYVADEKGLRITSSKKVTQAEMMAEQSPGANNIAGQDANAAPTLDKHARSANESKNAAGANNSTEQDWVAIGQAKDLTGAGAVPVPIQLDASHNGGIKNNSDADQEKKEYARSFFGLGGDNDNSGSGSDPLYTGKRYCGFLPKVNLRGPRSHIDTAVPGQYPWSAAILSSNNVFQCAGTLVSESIVLTTASCILNYQKSNSPLKVVLGAYSLPVRANDAVFQLEVFVKSAVIHPQYKADASPQNQNNNIGLLRLVVNIDFDLYPLIFPVCIVGPALEAQAGTSNCIVLGFPDLHTNRAAGVNGYLHSGDVSVSRTGCAGSSSCVNGPVCNGNEGSEVICQSQNSTRFYQWGIVAAEPQCPGNTPSASALTVSVIDNFDFINKYLWTPNPNSNPPQPSN